MTTEEAKKAGFRTASGALYVYWCIENGHIYVRSCDACALTGNDFPTRAKARDALRKRKENEEVNRKSRFIDNFVQPMQEYLSSKSKSDAKHAKWLADMQSQTTPITAEQAKMLREGDSWYYYNPVIKSISECVKLIAINADQSFGRYFTRSAAQAALDKAKCSTLPEGVAPVPEGYEFVDPNKIEIVMVDSKTYIFDVEEKRWHLLNGFNSGLMVSTKWNLEHGIYFARPKTEAEPQPKVGDFCDELDIIRARCRNTPWLAKHGNKGMVYNNNTDKWEPEPTKSLDDFPINKEEPAYSTEISGNAEDLTLQTSLVLNHERGKSPSKFISFANYKGIIPDKFTLDTKNFDLPALQELINKAFVPMFRGQPKEVVTDETQDPEPVKCIMDGDEFCGITPEWQAWQARQDAKVSNKEHVAPVEVAKRGTTESERSSNKPDAVSHPSHYTSHPSGVECITITKHMNFCRGNAVKYLWRAGQKGDSIDKEIEDIAKAEEYCRIEKERLIATKGAK